MRCLRYSCSLLLLLLTACIGMAAPTSTCVSFTALQGRLGQTFTLDEFRDWVSKQYGIKKIEEIEVENYSNIGANFSWQVDEYQYKAFVEDGEFRRLLIARKGSGKIQMSDMIACFGSPEFYRAVHTLEINSSDSQYFDLFFPSIGVVAHGYRNYTSKNHATMSIKDNFPVSDLSILRPGTAGEMLEQIYGTATPFEYGAIRVWSGGWEDIMIDVAPEVQQLQSVP